MKRKLIFPCIMALTFVSGCIKEQGEEPFVITREDIKEYDENAKVKKNENKDSISYTLVTAIGGFAIGESKIDVVDTNTFRVFQSGSKRITDLDCYVELSSEFTSLELGSKTVSEVGYVYSHTNKYPIVDGSGCDVSGSQYLNRKNTGSDATIAFSSGCHSLDFNTDYYVRSYAILENEEGESSDTIYNQRVLKLHTTLPEDVWVQRNDANMSNRFEAISCVSDEKVYLYGGKSGSTYFNDMWVYNKDNDVWSQLADFTEGSVAYYTGVEKRANGAMFVYPTSTDKVIYIIGGEIEGGKLTEKVIYYSIDNNRYCNPMDHPNYSTQKQLYIGGVAQYYKKQKLDDDGQPMYDENDNPIEEDDKTRPFMVSSSRAYVEDLPLAMCGNKAFVLSSPGGLRYYVGFGKGSNDNLISTFYEYQVGYDLTDGQYPNLHTLTWTAAGTTSERLTGEALYQPVVEVCGSRIIVGTGESSKGGLSKNFYQLSVDVDGTVSMGKIADVPENFSARANAASFYLTYTKNGEAHERFYVGTGRTFKEGESGNLLGDLWYYDFSTEKWGKARDFSNSTYCREGAVGFAINRNDDFDKDVSNVLEEQARGVFTLGRGYHVEDNVMSYYKDAWEYLP